MALIMKTEKVKMAPRLATVLQLAMALQMVMVRD
jgi:hypothetical protein